MSKLYNKLVNIQPLLMAPEDVTNGSGTIKSGLTQDAILEALNKDDDDPEVLDLSDKDKKEEKDDDEDASDKENKGDKDRKEDDQEDDEEDEDKKDKDDEDDNLNELEDELEEPDEEKLELVTPVRRGEILKKYPNLFKDFPYLEKAYFREQQYTELLPTIDDAKEAIDKSQTLDKLEKDLLDGNISGLLRASKDHAPKSFNKLVDGYLDTLHEVDPNAHLHVIGNVIKNTIVAMANEARTNENNKSLLAAAQLLNQFVFGSSEFVPPKKLSGTEKVDDKNTEREEELNKRERQFSKQRFDTAKGELDERVGKSLRNTVDIHIDPKKNLSDYVKKVAVKEVLDTVEKALNSDTRLKAIENKLWKRAAENNYSKDWLDKIRSARLQRAKTLLPSAIQKARNEALKGMGKRTRGNKEDDQPHRERSNEPRDKSDTKRSSKTPPAGKSVYEALMDDSWNP
jgi:hypothetical protein